MTTSITIALPDGRWQKLQDKATQLRISPEELVRASVEELLERPEEDFRRALDYLLEKNAELYRRLA